MRASGHRRVHERRAQKKTPTVWWAFSAANRYLLAEWTGLEPATPGVTGRYSNQLNYHSALV